MTDNALDSVLNWNSDGWFQLITSPSLKTIQLAVIIYLGLLWLSIIIWVTRDAINRSTNILFQAFAILLNIIFPILGTLLYLIIRPGKTVAERYYEELEHQLILENIQQKDQTPKDTLPLKALKKKPAKKNSTALVSMNTNS